MTRSFNTLATVVITLVALLALGGASLKNFAFALLVGICSGGYHSIFYSAPLVLGFRKRQLEAAAKRRRAGLAQDRTVTARSRTESTALQSRGGVGPRGHRRGTPRAAAEGQDCASERRRSPQRYRRKRRRDRLGRGRGAVRRRGNLHGRRTGGYRSARRAERRPARPAIATGPRRYRAATSTKPKSITNSNKPSIRGRPRKA